MSEKQKKIFRTQNLSSRLDTNNANKPPIFPFSLSKGTMHAAGKSHFLVLQFEPQQLLMYLINEVVDNVELILLVQ